MPAPPDPQSAESAPPSEDPAHALCEALLSLRTPEEARRFLTDLCTPAEVRALSERWHVARLLDDAKLSYRQIHETTGVSTATVVRVARFLRDEPHKGYRLVLDRMKEAP